MSIIDTKSDLNKIVKEYGFPTIYIGPGEDESPYIPYKENLYIRHLAFDARNNMYANILWIKKGGMIGRHCHHGRLFGVTLEGSWRYLEHDWVAQAGSYMQESPGGIHSLVTDDPKGAKLMFWLSGMIEMYDDNGNTIETMDVFWFMNHYVSYCKEHNLPINKKLWI